MAARDLDAARARLLGTSVVPSASVRAAAEMLWATMMEVIPPVSQILPRRLNPKLDAFGRRRPRADKCELIALSFLPGEDELMDFLFRKLPSFHRRIMLVMLNERALTGKWVWTHDRALELMVSSSWKLESTQDPALLFKCARPRLVSKGFLRMVTYEEFSRGPEFVGLSLV